MPAQQSIIKSILIALLYGGIPVLIFGLEQLLQTNWASYGVYPRTFIGLRGILFSPFLHGSLEHIGNNTVSMVAMLFYFHQLFPKIIHKFLLFALLATGLWVWIAARPSYHIGSSGVLYAVFGFLCSMGFIKRQKRLIGLSFIMIITYGSMVWGIFPIEERISYESHLFGLIAGIAGAFYFRNQVVNEPKKKYPWDIVGQEQYLEEQEAKFGEDYWMTPEQKAEKERLLQSEKPKSLPMRIVYYFTPNSTKNID